MRRRLPAEILQDADAALYVLAEAFHRHSTAGHVSGSLQLHIHSATGFFAHIKHIGPPYVGWETDVATALKQADWARLDRDAYLASIFSGINNSSSFGYIWEKMPLTEKDGFVRLFAKCLGGDVRLRTGVLRFAAESKMLEQMWPLLSKDEQGKLAQLYVYATQLQLKNFATRIGVFCSLGKPIEFAMIWDTLDDGAKDNLAAGFALAVASSRPSVRQSAITALGSKHVFNTIWPRILPGRRETLVRSLAESLAHAKANVRSAALDALSNFDLFPAVWAVMSPATRSLLANGVLENARRDDAGFDGAGYLLCDPTALEAIGAVLAPSERTNLEALAGMYQDRVRFIRS
jgi:hypothetical protein